MKSIFFLWLMACGDKNSDASHKHQSSNVAEAQKTPTEDVSIESETKEETLPREEAKPERYSKKWLVIMHSSKEKNDPPKSWDRFQTVEEETHPTILNSGYYKNLMPCWFVTIADGFTEKKSALKLSKTLKKAGVENYIKNAGNFVGKDSRIDMMCENAEKKSKTTDLLIGIAVQGHIQIPLDAPEIHTKRIVEKYEKKVKALQVDVWFTSIPTQHVGKHKIGDAYTVLELQGNGVAQKCMVEGFSLMVRGIPHFSIRETKRPKCGEPQIFAQLDCENNTLEKPYLVIPSNRKLQNIVRVAPEKKEISSVSRDSVLNTVYRKVQKEAKEKQESLQSKFYAQNLVTTEGEVLGSMNTIEYLTGEGFYICGGADIYEKYTAIFHENSRISPFMSVLDSSILSIIDPLSENPLFVHRDWISGLRIVNTKGEPVFILNRAFCDCRC